MQRSGSRTGGTAAVAGRIALIFLVAFASATTLAEPTRFSTPAAADDVLEASDLPFTLNFVSDHWAVSPQTSDFRLLARVTHEQHPISGAFVYREETASEAAVRERAREELTAAFDQHDIEGFAPRTINDAPVLFMRASGTTGEGCEFVIRTYYWTGPEGVADYSLVAPRDVFEAERDAIMGLLNGLEIGASDAE